jgi:IS5 family transposase
MVSLGCFAELMVTQKSKGATRLEKIEAVVNWGRFEYRLSKILSRSGLGPTGYPPVQLFKVLILQNLYGLSDPVMEEMLYDRLSFRRFCGFSLSDKIPDETTLCRFRGVLAGSTDKLFALVMQELTHKGLRLKSGTVIDATVIESGVRAPCGGEVSEKDPEAGWTKKGGEYIHGYKAHVSCDEETSLIKRVIATSADVHDSQVFGQLLDGDESAVYADKAYGSKENRDLLKENGTKDKLMHKGKKGSKQPWWDVMLNKIWGKTRGGIERIFAHWKTGMGLGRSRYKGWARHQVHFDLIAMAYNLRRAIALLARSEG